MTEQTNGLSLERLEQIQISLPDNLAIFAPHAGFLMPPDYLSMMSSDFQSDAVALFDQTDWGTAVVTHKVQNTVQSPGHRFAGDANRDPEGEDKTFVMERSFGGRGIWQIYPNRSSIVRQRNSREQYHRQCEDLVTRILSENQQVLVADIHDTSDWRNTPKGWVKREEFKEHPEFAKEGYPAFVLGTLDGQTASPHVTSVLAEEIVSACHEFGVLYRGRSVSIRDILINIENKGGYATKRLGLMLAESLKQRSSMLFERTTDDVINGLHVVQVEANRDDITGVDARTQEIDLQKAHRYRLAMHRALANTATRLSQIPIENWRKL